MRLQKRGAKVRKARASLSKVTKNGRSKQKSVSCTDKRNRFRGEVMVWCYTVWQMKAFDTLGCLARAKNEVMRKRRDARAGFDKNDEQSPKQRHV